MSQENVDLVRSAYDAFAGGDMDTVTRLLAATEWHEAEGMPYAGVFTGAEAILGNVLGPMNQDVDGFSVKPDELLDAGDKVLSLGRYGGEAANGPLDLKFAHVWTVEDGALVRFDHFTDTKVYGEAVGK